MAEKLESSRAPAQEQANKAERPVETPKERCKEPLQVLDAVQASLTLAPNLGQGNFGLAVGAWTFGRLQAAHSSLACLTGSLEALSRNWYGYKLDLHTLFAIAGNELGARTEQIGCFKYAYDPDDKDIRYLFFLAKALTLHEKAAYLRVTPSTRAVLSKACEGWLGSSGTERVLPIQIVHLRPGTSADLLVVTPTRISRKLGGILLIVYSARLFLLSLSELEGLRIFESKSERDLKISKEASRPHVLDDLKSFQIESERLLSAMMARAMDFWLQDGFASSWVDCYDKVVEPHTMPGSKLPQTWARASTHENSGPGPKTRPKTQLGARRHHVLDKDMSPEERVRYISAQAPRHQANLFYGFGRDARQSHWSLMDSETRVNVIAFGKFEIGRDFLPHMEPGDVAKIREKMPPHVRNRLFEADEVDDTVKPRKTKPGRQSAAKPKRPAEFQDRNPTAKKARGE